MQAIPDQMVSRLPPGCLRRQCPVNRVSETEVELENGELLYGSQVIFATPAHVTARLINGEPPTDLRRVVCLYYTADKPPIDEPILVLNGEAEGPINNLTVPSIVSRNYASGDRHLISIFVVDDDYVGRSDLESMVRQQCRRWFGDGVEDWRFLKQYTIENALPDQSAGKKIQTGHARLHKGMIVCGDHLGHGSIQSALESGRNAAEMVLA